MAELTQQIESVSVSIHPLSVSLFLVHVHIRMLGVNSNSGLFLKPSDGSEPAFKSFHTTA